MLPAHCSTVASAVSLFFHTLNCPAVSCFCLSPLERSFFALQFRNSLASPPEEKRQRFRQLQLQRAKGSFRTKNTFLNFGRTAQGFNVISNFWNLRLRNTKKKLLVQNTLFFTPFCSCLLTHLDPPPLSGLPFSRQITFLTLKNRKGEGRGRRAVVGLSFSLSGLLRPNGASRRHSPLGQERRRILFPLQAMCCSSSIPPPSGKKGGISFFFSFFTGNRGRLRTRMSPWRGRGPSGRGKRRSVAHSVFPQKKEKKTPSCSREERVVVGKERENNYNKDISVAFKISGKEKGGC